VLSAIAPILGAAATLYGLGAAAASLLQARRIRRTRTSAGVSLGFLSSYVGGYAMWLMYGASINSLPLIVVDAVGIACGGLTLAIALRTRRLSSQTPDRPAGSAHVNPHLRAKPVAQLAVRHTLTQPACRPRAALAEAGCPDYAPLAGPVLQNIGPPKSPCHVPTRRSGKPAQTTVAATQLTRRFS
jgi:uncharacterized protein with PQ loop repeat